MTKKEFLEISANEKREKGPKKEAEILAQLELVGAKLFELRDLLNPILRNTPQEEEKSPEPTNLSDVMYRINRINEQINLITNDIDIN